MTMPKIRRNGNDIRLVACLALASFQAMPARSSEVTLSGDGISIAIDDRGELAVTDPIGGRTWDGDPWGEGAGLMQVKHEGRSLWWKLSSCSDITVNQTGERSAEIVFDNSADSAAMPRWSLKTEVRLTEEEGAFALRVLDLQLPAGYSGLRLHYPLRPFSLRTDVDRGAAAIPFWQGVIIPSYIFPMNGGKFCTWDDALHGKGAIGELRYYGWNDLTMPWFGIHDDRSAILAVVPYDGSVGVQWTANHNRNEETIARQHRPSTDPRILALTPVWDLPATTPETRVDYHLIPGGDHVAMAKRYRGIAEANGLLVTLEEKARQNPDVRKLAGAIYTGIYGGYPHYLNLEGMAFTFDDLDRMVRDMREELGVPRAFIHAWGTFSKYPPVMWPISEDLGGPEKLKAVVDRVKGYGWLYSSYHSFVSLLDHDPDYSLELAPRDEQGRPEPLFRWKAVDESHWVDLAKVCLPREIAAIGQNADVTDIAFTSRVGEEGRKLAEYLASTGLVLGTERGNEWLVPTYHLFEGMVTAYRPLPISYYSHPAPLFNLVYHDAVVNYGKIQDPNHLPAGVAGDFYIKTLRAMLFGDGPMVFFSPYEYEGVRPYLRFAAQHLSPLHRAIAFEELVDHAYLSPDFLVQRSRFANGYEVSVNLGPTPFATDDGALRLRGYGFEILKPEGDTIRGSFRHSVEWGDSRVTF